MVPDHLESDTDEAPVDTDRALDPADVFDTPAVAALRRDVHEAVERRGTDGVVESQLERLQRAVERRSGLGAEDLDRLVESLAGYAYQVVASWFTIIFDSGSPELPGSLSAVTDRDVDDLARDTVARAIVGFREELARIRPWLSDEGPDAKKLFLLECLLQLTDAYERWLRETDRVSWDETEQIGADSDVVHPGQLLRQLTDQVCNYRERVTYRLQRAGLPGAGRRATKYSQIAVEEIVDATVVTLRSAARDWAPEGADEL